MYMYVGGKYIILFQLHHSICCVGKTLLAKAVANQTSATFLRVCGSELIQKYLGEGPKLVRELFRVAEEHAPSIVFIDEIDAIGTKRSATTTCIVPQKVSNNNMYCTSKGQQQLTTCIVPQNQCSIEDLINTLILSAGNKLLDPPFIIIFYKYNYIEHCSNKKPSYMY